MIDSNTVWRTNSILASVTLPYCIFFFIKASKIKLKVIHYRHCLLRKSIFLHQWEDSHLMRSEWRRDLQHHAFGAIIEFFRLYNISKVWKGTFGQARQRSPLHKEYSFCSLLSRSIEVSYRSIFHGFEIEIRSRMNSFKFFKAHRKIELNIASCVRIVGEVKVIVKPVVFLTKTETPDASAFVFLSRTRTTSFLLLV